MASKWQLFLLSAFILNELSHAFIIPLHPDNDKNIPKDQFSRIKKLERNLSKYRNFYANLLQEENPDFAAEIQELFNIVSTARVEPHIMTKLYYYLWLVESTKNLEDYLLSKGYKSI